MRLFRAKFAVFLLLSAVLSACEAAVDDGAAAPEQPALADAAALPPAPTASTDCGENGFLRTEIFGALDGDVDWDAGALVCEGMPRPDGDGARLRFAGTVAGEFDLAFIVALPGLQPGEMGKELQSKVTIIEEGAGRFFSNAHQDSCWTDILELEAQPDSKTQFAIRGTLYCVAPLVEVRGDSDVTLGEVNFRGLLDWETP